MNSAPESSRYSKITQVRISVVAVESVPAPPISSTQESLVKYFGGWRNSAKVNGWGGTIWVELTPSRRAKPGIKFGKLPEIEKPDDFVLTHRCLLTWTCVVPGLPCQLFLNEFRVRGYVSQSMCRA